MLTCHLHSSLPLASSLHATKSSPPTFTPLQFPSVVPVRKTDPDIPIVTPLMTSKPVVPSYRSHDAQSVETTRLFHKNENARVQVKLWCGNKSIINKKKIGIGSTLGVAFRLISTLLA